MFARRPVYVNCAEGGFDRKSGPRLIGGKPGHPLSQALFVRSSWLLARGGPDKRRADPVGNYLQFSRLDIQWVYRYAVEPGIAVPQIYPRFACQQRLTDLHRARAIHDLPKSITACGM